MSNQRLVYNTQSTVTYLFFLLKGQWPPLCPGARRHALTGVLRGSHATITMSRSRGVVTGTIFKLPRTLTHTALSGSLSSLPWWVPPLCTLLHSCKYLIWCVSLAVLTETGRCGLPATPPWGTGVRGRELSLLGDTFPFTSIPGTHTHP